MTQHKHTPGPWKVCGQSWVSLDGKKGHNIGVESKDGRILAVLGNNIEADVRLIAAAPELLEVAKMWLHNEKCINANAGTYEGEKCGDCSWCFTKQIIEKAEGHNAS